VGPVFYRGRGAAAATRLGWLERPVPLSLGTISHSLFLSHTGEWMACPLPWAMGLLLPLAWLV
jgi:hypothetical protein